MASNTLNTRIVLRNDTKLNWEAAQDVVLLKGEIGIEFDPSAESAEKVVHIKIGDGVSMWSQLPYFKGDLSNYYSKSEVEELISNAIKGIEFPEPDLSNYYNKGEIDTKVAEINGKFDNYYNKTEIDGKVDTINGSINTVDQKFSGYYNKEEVEGKISEAINAIPETDLSNYYTKDDVYNKGEVNDLISGVTIDELDADKVTFSNDLVFTKTFGKYVPDATTGSVTIPTATDNMSLKDLLLEAFSEETDPSVTDPAVSFSSVAEGSKEVGTEVTLSYTASLSAGSYTYGPATGITAKTWEVSVANIEGSSKLTTNSSNFGKVTVKDGDSAKYKITAKATYDAGAMPVTNLGNDCPAKQIAAGSKSKTSSGLTGYRAWFHCYRPGGSLIDINSITSDTIRNNIGSDTKTKWVSKNGSFTSSLATTNMQQIFFAAPAGVVKSVAVAHSVNGAPQTVLTKTIYVKGASNYVTSDAPNGMAYDLFYVSNDNPNDGSATYTITVTKN